MNNLNSDGTKVFTDRTYKQIMESDEQKAITEYFNNYQVPRFINTSQYTNGNATRALSSYSIKASDDNSESNDNKILQLDIDDCEWVGINENVQAI
uniref:hypothetical protein n=1 Tax=Endozoicomonas sp. SESOKO2 TaxID=2828743 RepID=UPI00214900DE